MHRNLLRVICSGHRPRGPRKEGRRKTQTLVWAFVVSSGCVCADHQLEAAAFRAVDGNLVWHGPALDEPPGLAQHHAGAIVVCHKRRARAATGKCRPPGPWARFRLESNLVQRLGELRACQWGVGKDDPVSKGAPVVNNAVVRLQALLIGAATPLRHHSQLAAASLREYAARSTAMQNAVWQGCHCRRPYLSRYLAS